MTDETIVPAEVYAATGSKAPERRGERHAARKWLLVAALALVAAADWLFWGHLIGWTLGAFALALLLVAAAANRDLLARPFAWIVLLLDAGLCVAMVEDPSLLAVGLYIVGLGSFLCLGVRGVLNDARAWCEGLALAAVQGCLRTLGDAASVPAVIAGAGGKASIAALLRKWLLPLAGAVIFLELFASANPVIGAWLDRIDPSRAIAELPAAERVVFWAVSGAAIWLVLRTRLAHVEGLLGFTRANGARPSSFADVLAWLFSAPAIVRSMIVFNLLFAVQNGMDATYLWGNAALPAGFTFAAYAHRGAYPLMVTAVLAAAFVLVAFRPGADSEHDRGARALMYVWIAQNVVLVASSIWRMVLYVEAYSLTHARVAALVWMALVALGLVLIVARFAFEKSNMWLVDANVLVLIAVLYAGAFADTGGFIAGYNVRHCREVTGRGTHLDLKYIAEIGPRALPALRGFIETAGPRRADGNLEPDGPLAITRAIALEARLRSDVAGRLSDWRAWTYLHHRISRGG